MVVETETQTPLELEGFDEFVLDTMKQWKVPGTAIAIARDGEIVFSRGFGLRDVEADLAVTPETLFAIGSSSKAFTTMTMGLLADEGKLDWDTPARHYLPSFAMHDRFAGERMTPRDLVTHRSGLPRHDLAWYNSSATRRELVERLQYLEPSKDFRTVFQYQNLMFLTAGYLVGEIAGSSWEEVLQERLLAPLGMANSNTSVEVSRHSDNFAYPYDEKDGAVTRIPFRDISTVGPAGSINSSIADMGNWLLLHLNKGMHGETRLISEGQLSEMHKPQMVVDPTFLAPFEELPYASYGMGWLIQPYLDHPMIHHSGGIDGFTALVTFMPRDNIGAVILTNLNGNPTPYILAHHLYERLLGLEPLPWNERYQKLYDEAKSATATAKEQTASNRVPNTTPSHALAEYSGEYHHPGYGTATVALDGDALTFTYNNMTRALAHYHYDIFDFTDDLFEMRFAVSFVTGEKGAIERLSVPLEPAVDPIVFKRLPAKAMTEPDFLAQFVGEYDVMGTTLHVALKGEHQLVASLPGQPGLELEGVQGMEFTVKGMPGFSLAFQTDEAGTVTGAVLTQPGGAFQATKR
ncbi:MAG: serine hydrolase [Chloroflexota bacterium]|nr:serine hydrolase [Chloroflexota bacterium]